MYFRNEGDRAVVLGLARLQESKEAIAAAVGVSKHLLEKHYPDELARLRPAHPNIIDMVVVSRMVEVGFTQAQIAVRMSLSERALRKYYARELA